MLIYCKHCGGKHQRGEVCGKAPKKIRQNYYTNNTNEARFRNTQRWKDKAEAIKERDYHLCRWCLHNKIIQKNGLSVHHIEPLAERYDLRLEDENLITLCSACHARAERNYINKNILHDLAGNTPPDIGKLAVTPHYTVPPPAKHTKFPKRR